MRVKTASRIAEIQEYFFSKKLKEIAKLNQSGDAVINLGIGSPDLPPHTDVVEELNQSAQQDSVHGYQPYVGLAELREAMANFYTQHYGVSLNPVNEVMPLIGSKEGIMHISMTFLEKGDEVLIPNPGYPAYAATAKLSGATPRYYKLDPDNNWFPNLEELEKSDLSKVKIMWVTYPNMPTGAPASMQIFEDLVAFGLRNDILIVNDNPYSFILNDNPKSILAVEGAKEIAIELNSLSKSHNMAGWRIGMMMGNKDYLSEILKFKSNMDSGVFKPLQLASIKALNLSTEWFSELNKTYRERKEVACQIYDDLGVSYDSKGEGLFVWGKIPTQYNNGFELSDKLLYEARVFITPGGIFGSQGDNYIRISLCTSTEKLELARTKIKNCLQSISSLKTISV